MRIRFVGVTLFSWQSGLFSETCHQFLWRHFSFSLKRNPLIVLTPLTFTASFNSCCHQALTVSPQIKPPDSHSRPEQHEVHHYFLLSHRGYKSASVRAWWKLCLWVKLTNPVNLSPLFPRAAHRLWRLPALHGDISGERHSRGALSASLHLLQEQDGRLLPRAAASRNQLTGWVVSAFNDPPDMSQDLCNCN